jgi:hypothetical protein
MVGKSKPATTAEKNRMKILKEHVPCIPCLLAANKIRLPSIQHTVSGFKRDGHMSTYSLCDWHHFGHPLKNWQNLPGHIGGPKQATSGLLGPSLTWGRRPYESFFGREELLVKIASRLVASFQSAPWFDYNVPYDIRRKVQSYWEKHR